MALRGPQTEDRWAEAFDSVGGAHKDRSKPAARHLIHRVLDRMCLFGCESSLTFVQNCIRFGPDVTKRFLGTNGLSLCIRSHEVGPIDLYLPRLALPCPPSCIPSSLCPCHRRVASHSVASSSRSRGLIRSRRRFEASRIGMTAGRACGLACLSEGSRRQAPHRLLCEQLLRTHGKLRRRRHLPRRHVLHGRTRVGLE
eukprot:763598-Hanusia_phi.AAC.2